MSTKGSNFCYVPFAFLDDEPLPKWGVFSEKEFAPLVICSPQCRGNSSFKSSLLLGRALSFRESLEFWEGLCPSEKV